MRHLVADYRAGEQREEGRRLFVADGPLADQAAARAILAAAIGPRVAFHRLILSPGPRSGLTRSADVRAWARYILMDLSHALGQRLVYVAAIHTNTNDPHGHVLIGGAAARTCWPDHGVVKGVELRQPHWCPGGFLETRGDVRAAEIRARNGDGTAA